MKAYILTTAIVFALVTIAHIFRIAAEGARLLTEPAWVLLTLLALGLCLWGFRLLVRWPRT